MGMGLEQTSPRKGGPSSRWGLRITGKMDCLGEGARTASESLAPRERLENLGWAGLLLIWPEINKGAASFPDGLPQRSCPSLPKALLGSI